MCLQCNINSGLSSYFPSKKGCSILYKLYTLANVVCHHTEHMHTVHTMKTAKIAQVECYYVITNTAEVFKAI